MVCDYSIFNASILISQQNRLATKYSVQLVAEAGGMPPALSEPTSTIFADWLGWLMQRECYCLSFIASGSWPLV
jgi:hypothetical protein